MLLGKRDARDSVSEERLSRREGRGGTVMMMMMRTVLSSFSGLGGVKSLRRFVCLRRLPLIRRRPPLQRRRKKRKHKNKQKRGKGEL